MKVTLKLFMLLGMYVFLTSSVCIEKREPLLNATQSNAMTGIQEFNLHKRHKLTFFKRLALKLLLKKYKLNKSVNADKLASTSLLLGILACGFLLLGMLLPYFILATIPAGIAAMITGGSAVRNKTSLVGKAKTGKGLGLGAIIGFAFLLLLAVIIIASAGSAFFG